MKAKQKDIPASHKIVSAVSILISILVVLFALLQLFNVWEKSINICIPLLGAVNSCQAYLQWNTNRKLAYFSIAIAALIFLCSIAAFFL